MRRFAFLLTALAAFPCAAATLRPIATLDGPVVRLSDLFDDAGKNAARVLGPAPPLGAQVIVEAAQLAAIAHQFGVDWGPLSPADRVVIDRPGRPMPRDAILDAVRDALVRAGAPEQCEIELPGFEAPMVAMKGDARPLITQVEYDAGSGRFGALLSITSEAMDPLNVRLAGRLEETADVLVPATRLSAGTVLRPQDVRIARLRAGQLRGEVAHAPEQVVGLALRHGVTAGQPIVLEELGRPAAVAKSAIVMLQLEARGLLLAGQGQALEAGAIGERVRVLNPTSRAVLLGEVTGPGSVRIDPGSMPIVQAAHADVAALR